MTLVRTVVFFAIGLTAAAIYVLVSRPDAARRFDAARRPAAEVSPVQGATPRAAMTAPGPGESATVHDGTESAPDGTALVRDRLAADRDRLAAEGERIAAVKRRMAENLYRRGGLLLAGRFASRGLAPDDAKAIIRTFADAMAGCLFEAARKEAAARSIALDDLLADLEADFASSDAGKPGRLRPLGGLDRQAVERRAEPCVLDASQEAGIPFH